MPATKRGDTIEGADLLRMFNLHPGQLEQMKVETAQRLGQPDQVIVILSSQEKLSPKEAGLLAHLKHAKKYGTVVREHV